ncbi:MAG: head-tail connector protein [Rhizobiaceae bacterium]
MVMTRLTAPAVEPVTLAEARAHLRVTSSSEDALISNLIASAREEVEAATGVALITQDWRLYLDAWPECAVVRLPKHPVQSVSAVTVYDAAGAPTSIVPSAVNLDRASRPARFARPESAALPGKAMNGTQIDFRAGFGATGVDVPDGLKRAILLLVAFWFEHRGTGQTSNQEALWPDGFERIINRYRRMEL